MKADLFILYSLLAIAALFAYVFIGGLVVRAWNALPIIDEIEDGDQTIAAAMFWPVILVAAAGIAIAMLCSAAIRLSQWRPRRKSKLPGARVVRP